ncbi:MAG: glycosyltransferase [Rhodocyclaceae bacterium]|nr:glycosyltransferase [Rhodocyclaceae bacterium]
MKKVLMVAFHFPPIQGSSGVQRTLRFARHLPEFGWQPIILTAHPRAYPSTTDDQLADIPDNVTVLRAPAWDASRHFSIGGRYPALLARPDRWISWWLGAVPAGLRAIKQLQPDALWSTYPIATAHRIAASLHGRSQLPWIADFRDPMAQEDYPTDPAVWRSFARIEAHAMTHAKHCTFTTPSAMAHYQQRYAPPAGRLQLIENGYDEESFAGASQGAALNPGHLTLLHSGIVYPSERDPTRLFTALSQLKAQDADTFGRLRVRFRAAVHDEMLRTMAREAGVESAIEICPAVGYREALAEMMAADGLLILQAANCNAQIPAKLYEYLRAGRPILALTDPAGDTAATCRSAGLDAIAALDDATAIAAQLKRFVHTPNDGTLPSAAAVEDASRRGRARMLATLLDDVSIRAV